MPAEILMIVIVSVVGGLLYSAYEKYMDYKTKLLKSKNNSNVSQEQIDELRERVAVLEKIVTDEKYNLRSEIDALDKAS